MLKRKNIIILIIAVLCGLIGVISIVRYVNSVETVFTEKPMKEVVIAAQTIPENVRVRRDMLQLVSIEAEYLLSQSCTRVEDVVGSMTKSSIFKGEQILEGRITRGDKPGDFSYGLPEGKRAMALALEPVKGVAGFIQPHDRIDLIATMEVPEDNSGSVEGEATASDGSQTVNVAVKVSWMEELKKFQEIARKLLEGRRIISFDGKTITFTLYQNIEVLAVGSETRRPELAGGSKPKDESELNNASTIVLCLDPEQAEMITNIEKVGSVRFTLRNPGDDRALQMEPIVEYKAK